MSSGILNRRQFVVLGGTAVFTMAAGLPVFGSTVLPTSFVSVGFCPTHSRLRIGGRTSSPAPFVDAGTVLSGDPRFFRNGARLRLHSFQRGPGNRRQERIDVEALFRVPELDTPVPYFAFSSIESSSRKMTSHSVAFNVPVESTSDFEIAIERRSLERSTGPERAVIPFAVNDGGSPSIKLNDGLYAFAFLGAGEKAPDWRSVRSGTIVRTGDVSPVRLVDDGLGGPVPFDYLLMSISRPRGSDELELPDALEMDPSAVGTNEQAF